MSDDLAVATAAAAQKAAEEKAKRYETVWDAETKEKFHEIREEAKAHRLKAEAAEAARVKTETEASERVKAAESAAEQRVIKTEMRALVKDAGIVDVDGLQFADMSKVKYDKDGNLTGAEDAIAALKAAKPYLFGENNTSSTRKPPKTSDVKPKSATEMTDAEYAEHKRSLGIKR